MRTAWPPNREHPSTAPDGVEALPKAIHAQDDCKRALEDLQAGVENLAATRLPETAAILWDGASGRPP